MRDAHVYDFSFHSSINMAKKRVIVAMSSGVDSSVAAAILKKQGYDVVGVFMHFWKEPGSDALRENKCCSLESQEDARKVAHKLGIPLYTVNAANDFKRDVVDYFLSETKAGRTPNPCVTCNEKIKFNFLFKKMLEMDADLVATGHYADVKMIDGKYHLYTSTDEEKDQTYFLYNLRQEHLGRIIFPVGKYKKPQIRKMAKEMEIPVFDKDDSQGLCFTPEKYPTEFIKRNMQLEGGDIVDTSGKKIGKHEGLQLYTIGQRRGINIGGTGPYYVVGRNFEKNELVVTNDEKDGAIFRTEMEVENVNWLADEPQLPLETNVKIRYRHSLVRGIIHPVKSRKAGISQGEIISRGKKKVYMVEFKEPQKAVTPGQSAVFYSDEGEVMGGGMIRN
ncbi:MAG TPA: tRNA 2-thiouridine(34) synthase MnmA [Candidatus Moranbacteria bacterium]|nr:MAG: tRNA-specific 2-thiouridylase MnmA [Parcubacteria group bacterium GW2011_GWC1_45_14]HAV11552.1 tRNA 2-thiouridine(34) synthase MnmA [Candidatus Moranbacteria bacterium]